MTVELFDGTEKKGHGSSLWAAERGAEKQRVINKSETADPVEKTKELWNHGKDDAWNGDRNSWCGKPIASTSGKRKKMYNDD